ncbi:MAG: winged helix-turn-helix transcriptional regulator [Chloroflexi bacterium]|nr:winged helix-turn-helix transcriptional regulator [Chloroflexota bacterium]
MSQIVVYYDYPNIEIVRIGLIVNCDSVGSFALKMQRLITELVRNFELCDKKCMARYGVTAAQGIALLAIPEGSNLTMNELSEILGLANSTVTTTVDHLSNKGLANRMQDYEDRRVVRVGLSDRGQDLRRALEKEKQEMLEVVLGDIPDGERATIVRSLERITSVIRKAVEGSYCTN